MDTFKVPEDLPQDLLLIQEFVDTPLKISQSSVKQNDNDSDDDVSSSAGSHDGVSEDEIAANLVVFGEESENTSTKSLSEPSETSSESNSDSEDIEKAACLPFDQYLDDDEDPVPNVSSGTYPQVFDANINVPDIDEVGPDETIEKVGEIVNIMDRVVIVRGVASEALRRGSECALDSDTLLVFDDRKVMGYIYETFGPTSQPLYQIQYNTVYPLDPERVRPFREVYHVPSRSNFVFLSQIGRLRGSDASNVHDEEPADNELEFSDDEAEAAFNSRLKRKRAESRSRSVASSRVPTPNPSHMRDQELVDDTFFSRNAYDEHGPYDVGFTDAGLSRPPPIPYDDPYTNDFQGSENPKDKPADHRDSLKAASSPTPQSNYSQTLRPEKRSRSRGRGGSRGDRVSFNRGGRGAHHNSVRRRTLPSTGNSQLPGQPMHNLRGLSEPYDPRISQPLSPNTSLAIAHVTGQGPYGHDVQISPRHADSNAGVWGYQQPLLQQPFASGQSGHQQPYSAIPFIQPHINPRFASAFGLSMGQGQLHQYHPGGQFIAQGASNHHILPSSSSGDWTDQWFVPTADHSSNQSTGESENVSR